MGRWVIEVRHPSISETLRYGVSGAEFADAALNAAEFEVDGWKVVSLVAETHVSGPPSTDG